MGAEQSSSRAGAESPAVRKTCYYELLSLDRQATEDEIRKAYKKKALELHPDRNFHDVENATRKFAEVQTAYEILSDPQERAWYDSHRDAILSGNDDVSGGPNSEHYNVRLTSAEDIFNLMGRFNSAVPMTDSPKGFFGILGPFFEQLAAEEAAACEWENQPMVVYPMFGSALDTHETAARPFYNIWTSFSTKKHFSWKDKYRLSDAPDRRVRRLMERENKKLRDEAIRDFNDAVRSLVALVKKRDPRYVLSTQSEAERQKVLRESAAAQAARSRAANQERLADAVVPDWAQRRDEADRNDEFSMSDEDAEVEHIECVVCSKIFKSEQQFEAHERSKKHTKAVQQLRLQMIREDAGYKLVDHNADVPSSPDRPADSNIEGRGDPGSIASPLSDNARKEMELEPQELPSSNKWEREDRSIVPSEDDNYAPRSEIETRLAPSSASEGSEDVEAANQGRLTCEVDGLSLHSQKHDNKPGKAKAKREKKAARAAAESKSGNNVCVVCKEEFSSRTKLFSHIKQLGHGVPIERLARMSKKKK